MTKSFPKVSVSVPTACTACVCLVTIDLFLLANVKSLGFSIGEKKLISLVLTLFSTKAFKFFVPFSLMLDKEIATLSGAAFEVAMLTSGCRFSGFAPSSITNRSTI